MALIEDARASGLILIEGAAVPAGDGYFVPVTLVSAAVARSRSSLTARRHQSAPMRAFGEFMKTSKYFDG